MIKKKQLTLRVYKAGRMVNNRNIRDNGEGLDLFSLGLKFEG